MDHRQSLVLALITLLAGCTSNQTAGSSAPSAASSSPTTSVVAVPGTPKTASEAPQKVRVPQVEGLGMVKAQMVLLKEGLDPVVIDDIRGQTARYVGRQDPDGGTVVEPGAEVRIVIMSGRPRPGG